MLCAMTSQDPSPSDPLHAVAYYNGLQDGGELYPSFQLWTLCLPLPGLVVGSTYARSTLERALSSVSNVKGVAID
jgi:hypothetical protein